jgi:hypothetical protein
MTLRTPAFNDARTYGFEWLRASTEALDIQEGVVNSGDLKVTAAVAGLQRVDIAAGAAFVKGDSGTPGTGLTQGLYYVVNDASVANAVTLTASNGSNPRLDQIIMRVLDTSDLGSASDTAVFEVVTGTATAGATLDNRTGAAALPNDAIRLADVLVPAGSTATSAGNIRDRRPWARGLQAYAFVTTDSAANTSASFVNTNLFSIRGEFSGAPVRISMWGSITGASAGAEGAIGLFLDGVEQFRTSNVYVPRATVPYPFHGATIAAAPAAGSRVASMWSALLNGTSITVLGSGTSLTRIAIEEVVRPQIQTQ